LDHHPEGLKPEPPSQLSKEFGACCVFASPASIEHDSLDRRNLCLEATVLQGWVDQGYYLTQRRLVAFRHTKSLTARDFFDLYLVMLEDQDYERIALVERDFQASSLGSDHYQRNWSTFLHS